MKENQHIYLLYTKDDIEKVEYVIAKIFKHSPITLHYIFYFKLSGLTMG